MLVVFVNEGRNYGCFECGSLALVCRAQQSMLRVVCLAAVLTITPPLVVLSPRGGRADDFFFLCPMLLCIFLFSLLFGCFTTGRGLVAFATASRDT